MLTNPEVGLRVLYRYDDKICYGDIVRIENGLVYILWDELIEKQSLEKYPVDSYIVLHCEVIETSLSSDNPNIKFKEERREKQI